MTSLKHAS